MLIAMHSRPYHHGDLRVALLDRAEQTLRERGAGALSLRELAREIGVSHAAPSRHFKDRRALLDALAVRGFERLITALQDAGRGSGSFRERMTAIAKEYVDFAVTEAALLDVMYTGKHEPDASADVRMAGERLGAVIFEVLAEGQRQGEVRDEPLDRIGLTAFASLHGLASLVASSMISTEGLPEVVDQLVEDVLMGLLPRSG